MCRIILRARKECRPKRNEDTVVLACKGQDTGHCRSIVLLMCIMLELLHTWLAEIKELDWYRDICKYTHIHTFFVFISLFFLTIFRRATSGNHRVTARLLFRSYVNTGSYFYVSWENSMEPRVGITCANAQSSLFVEYCSRRFCFLAFFFVLRCEYSGLLYETKNARGSRYSWITVSIFCLFYIYKYF